MLTGATGFIGAYILRELVLSGYENIRVIKRQDSRLDLISNFVEKVEFVEADLNDLSSLKAALTDVEFVIHAAAIVSFSPKNKNKLFKSNVEGTQNLVNLCLSGSVKKLIFISSVAALGRKKGKQLIDEKAKWTKSKENTLYAISKHQAEMEVWRGQHEGLPVLIINPSVVIGPGYWNKGSSSIISRVADTLPFYPPGSTGVVDVRDVTSMVLKLMQSDMSGERFICNGHNLSYQDLFTNIAKQLEVKAPSKVLHRVLASLSWRYYSLKAKLLGNDPIITRESVNNAFNNFSYDNSKSLKTLNFNYRNINETLEFTCNAFLEAKRQNKDFSELD